MQLSEAIANIHAPKGVTSVIAGLLSGDVTPIQGQSAIGIPLEAARARLTGVEEARENATSDWAYWGYAGDVAYWRCVVSLLEAAEICGADHLPDVPLPSLDGVVMDVQYTLEQWGRHVLALAKEHRGPEANPAR